MVTGAAQRRADADAQREGGGADGAAPAHRLGESLHFIILTILCLAYIYINNILPIIKVIHMLRVDGFTPSQRLLCHTRWYCPGLL